MICEFEQIELVSDSDVYVLKNYKPEKIQLSEWKISNISSGEERQIVPEKRQYLNCIIVKNLAYRIHSNDKPILCLYMPQEVLSGCVKEIEDLLE